MRTGLDTRGEHEVSRQVSRRRNNRNNYGKNLHQQEQQTAAISGATDAVDHDLVLNPGGTGAEPGQGSNGAYGKKHRDSPMMLGVEKASTGHSPFDQTQNRRDARPIMETERSRPVRGQGDEAVSCGR